MLDLTKFTRDEVITAPIVNGWGQYSRRKLFLPNTEDGWYSIKVGNTVEVIRKATPLEIDKALKRSKVFRVFPIGTEAVPWNFDLFTRNNWPETVNVNFMNLEVFEVAKVGLWEDGRFYYIEPEGRWGRTVMQKVKEVFNSEGKLEDLKDVTPEIRYYFLLLELQRQTLRALEEIERAKITAKERARRLAEFQASFAGRLQGTIEKAGGTLIKYTKQGTGYVVHWKIGDQTIKSTVRDDLRLVSAGFCLSGDDRKHTMASIVQLGRLFQQSRPLNITRI